ncbi:ATP-binding cassette domain-containing protein [Deinococcus daejeonensis]|uniref:ATP-binding cassette domain-containing protein n=1 Tax=Deinococcus daejeonensis TaxID=1007098 RepID=UPI00402B3A08
MTQPTTTPARRFQLPHLSTLGPLIALLIACLFFTFQSDRFLTLGTFSLILQQASFVGVIAIAQTLIVLTAGIDLSCGMIMALSSMVIGKLAVEQGVPVSLAILAGFAVGAFVGWANGLLITKWKLPPFIVTLGMYSIVFAAVKIYSKATSVPMPADGLTFLAQRFTVFGTPFTYGSLLMVALFILTWLFLRRDAVRRGGPAAAGTHRRRVPRGGHHREPREHHRRRDRRHQPLRRARQRPGHPDRRADRRRVPFGADVHGPGQRVPEPHHWHPDHPGGRHRPVLPEESMTAATHLPVNPGPQTARPLVMEARGLVKRYGHVTAIGGADFELRPGEIMAVIGDNGAGKSSLIKALSGALIPDEGEILLDGQPVHFRTPSDARRAGIETVYQDLAVAPAMTIAENLFLGRELYRGGALGRALKLIDRRRMLTEATEHMQGLQFAIKSMSQPVETLSGGQRQGVAVARAAAFAQHVVIMDEPTAALGVREGNMVLDLIRKVRDRGLPVILISHNMPHVFEIADRIHVHRMGRRAALLNPQKISMADTVSVMTGAIRPEDLSADVLAH